MGRAKVQLGVPSAGRCPMGAVGPQELPLGFRWWGEHGPGGYRVLAGS